MKYCDIIGLPDYFESYYDMTSEHKDYWMRFIPNDRFNDILKTTINSLEATLANERKSIFMQGTFGTGKSHAASVIKHLLWDDLNVISKYTSKLETQLRERVFNFRRDKKAFPVILKGISNITDNRTFSLAIEKAIKDALKTNNIEIQTESDFEKMIYQITENPLHIDWEQLITSTPDIKMYVNSTNDLINKLKNKDITILQKLETKITQKGGHFTISEIDKWLIEVLEELKNRQIADYLMIFWDEFTAIMQHHNRNELLNQLQRIAELSKSRNIFMFIISHKTAHQAGLGDDEARKTFDRFHIKDYTMEPITTYHLIAAAINKIDEEKYKEIQNRFFASHQLNDLIKKLSDDQGINVRNDIKNLFPIHPYTAYLMTFISRNIGSADRSVFKFLNDNQEGFLAFINQEIGEDIPVITANYLWDYFFKEFERDNSEKFRSVLDKFFFHTKKIEDKDKNYNEIFKGILLLNLLHRMITTGDTTQSILAPTIDNIKSLFLGSYLEGYVEEALNYIDSSQIIRKSIDNLFLVSSSTLSPIEVNKEKQKLINEYEDITRIFSIYQNLKDDLTDNIKNGILRDSEVCFYLAGEKEHILKQKISRDFKKLYSLRLAVFLAKDNSSISSIKSFVKQISSEEEFKNIIFIIVDKAFGEDNFDSFISFLAEAAVARNHNFDADANSSKRSAKRIVEEWINSIKNGFVTIIFNGDENQKLLKDTGSFIGEQISPRIFRYGLETLNECRKNQTVWNQKMAKKSTEIFLFADSRNYITSRTARGQEIYLRSILKDNDGHYVVSENLDIKENADAEHPLVKILKEVENRISNCQEHPNFNLGETLKFLIEPPYGIYPNMLNMALIGFILRNYIGRLYEVGTGRLIEKDMMRDKVNELFNFWMSGSYSNRLDVRFGTFEEKELVDNLKEIFKLDAIGLNDIRWQIRDSIKKVQFPLWSIKYLDINNNLKNTIEEICLLIKTPDSEIGYEDIKKILFSIKNNKLDLELTLKEEKVKQGFYVFLQNIETVNITEDEIDEVVQYLYRNMQEEIASWEEEKVKSTVKDWRLNKINRQTSLIPPAQELPQSILPAISIEDTINRVKDKVRNFSGDLKEVILKILEDRPDLIYIFDKYLDICNGKADNEDF